MCLAQDLKIRDRQRSSLKVQTHAPTLAAMADGCQSDKTVGPSPDEPWDKSSSQCVTDLHCHTAETARAPQVSPQAIVS